MTVFLHRYNLMQHVVDFTLDVDAYVSQVLMCRIRYERKQCFWQRIRLWNRHRNHTEALGQNGKSFHKNTFRQFGQMNITSTSTMTFCWTDS